MRKAIVSLVILFTVGLVFAQDANVITLSDSDTQTAKSLWEKKQAADAAWDTFSKKIEDKYATAQEGESGNYYGGHHYKSGWFGSGVTFSRDFKAIIPKQGVSGTTTLGGWTYPNCWGGTIQLNPAVN